MSMELMQDRSHKSVAYKARGEKLRPGVAYQHWLGRATATGWKFPHKQQSRKASATFPLHKHHPPTLYTTAEMQVHAVPDAERVFDSTGRKMPWGYDFAE
jgi:hypothetical protein